MPTNEENILLRSKELADTVLSTVGLLSPDKAIAMIKEHEERIAKHEKIIKNQAKAIRKLQQQVKSLSNPNIDTTDTDLDDLEP